MAKNSKPTPTKFTVAGINVALADTYNEGDTLNVAEASVLNQTLRENIRNAIASKVKADPELAQDIVDEYAATYKFGVRGARANLDPVAKEAKAIATIAVNNALAKRGIKKADYADYADAVTRTAAKDTVQAKAQEIVDARGNEEVIDVDLDQPA